MISIVTPAYNAARYLRTAIESVQSQDCTDWELIVVDDGSTDETLAIIKEYAARDSRIRWIETPHTGVSAARNAGLHAAKFDWIALLDSDDAFLPNRLSRQWAMAQANPSVVLWGANAYNTGADGRIIDASLDYPNTVEHFEKMYRRGDVFRIKTSSVLFRRELALQLGGFQSKFDSSEDAELWNRMADYGPIVILKEPLVNYRYHLESLSIRKARFQYDCGRYVGARNRARLAGKELTWEEFLPAYQSRNVVSRLIDGMILYSNVYWRKAAINLSNGKRLHGLFWICSSFLTNPPMIGWRLSRKILAKLTTAGPGTSLHD